LNAYTLIPYSLPRTNLSPVEVGTRVILGVGVAWGTYVVGVSKGVRLVNVDSGVFADVGTCVTLGNFATTVAATAVSSATAVSVPATRVAIRSVVDVGKGVEASDATSHARTPTSSMSSVSQYTRLFIFRSFPPPLRAGNHRLQRHDAKRFSTPTTAGELKVPSNCQPPRRCRGVCVWRRSSF
jgi:hypothetical protein